jgi:hypothetical protein
MLCSVKLETVTAGKAVPSLRWVFTGFTLLRPGSGYRGHLVDRRTQGYIFSEHFDFSHANCDFTNCSIFIYHLVTDAM